MEFKSMTRLTILVLACGLASGGCASPMQVQMQGQVTTRTPSDNLVSRLCTWTLPGGPSSGPAVAIIEVDGLLINKNLKGVGSMGENPVALFREKLEAVAADPNIHAVVLRINSPGGGVAATDIMRRDLLELKRCRNLPVIACVLEVGSGGALYLASAADTIISHPTALTGGVGVILNTYFLQDASGQFGADARPVKAGSKIDLGTPVREMDEAEREILERIARQFHDRFKSDLQSSRQRQLDPSVLDGRIFTAEEALQHGLIDSIGYLDDALVAARQSTGTEVCRVVMFRRSLDRAYTQYDTTPNTPLQNSIIPLNIPGLDRSALPMYMYLWQPDPSFVTASGGK